ncbi:MAG: hypothetical protein POH28_04830 [Acidocella sp.]|nr:hypothetical protein [Acidocella sp.]
MAVNQAIVIAVIILLVLLSVVLVVAGLILVQRWVVGLLGHEGDSDDG